MGAVHVGVDEPDGHRLVGIVVGAVRQVVDEGAGLCLVERSQYPSVDADAFGQDVAVLPLYEWGGEHEVQVVLLEATLGSHLDGVPEARRGDQRRAGPGARYQGVGGQGRTVDERVQVRQVGSSLGHDRGHPVQDPPFGSVVRGEDLRGEHPGAGLEDHVGEGATDVGSDSHGSAGHLVDPQFPLARTSASDGKSLGGMMSTVAERCCESIPPSTLMTSPVM